MCAIFAPTAVFALKQGTDILRISAPNIESSDFWSAEQQLYFQNQTKINAANKDYSDLKGGNTTNHQKVDNSNPSLVD